RERERRRAALASYGQRERPLLRVPVGALEDSRLPLEPAAVRVRDVVRPGGEDVEDEPAARNEERMRRLQSLEPRGVVQQMQVGAKRTGDEPNPLPPRRLRGNTEPSG